MLGRVVMGLAVLAAGCAARQQTVAQKGTQVAYSTPGQPKPQGKELCRMERDLGSNMMRKVCTYQDGDPRNREETQEMMRQMEQGQGQPIRN